MESTLKIDFEVGINKPVIKIITPSELNEDSDVRDKLIHEFLHTSPVSERNSLFTISTYFDLKSPFKLTTIEPLTYFDVIDRLRWEMIFRVMGIHEASECREYYDNVKNTISESKPVDGERKIPLHYNNYLKIVEFFNWVSEQPYVERRLS